MNRTILLWVGLIAFLGAIVAEITLIHNSNWDDSAETRSFGETQIGESINHINMITGDFDNYYRAKVQRVVDGDTVEYLSKEYEE